MELFILKKMHSLTLKVQKTRKKDLDVVNYVHRECANFQCGVGGLCILDSSKKAIID
jgi:hypothetical protein